MMLIVVSHLFCEINILFGLLWRLLNQNGKDCQYETCTRLSTRECAAKDSDRIIQMLQSNQNNLMPMNYID